ncbi:hypothetical protein F5B20DRAFT_125245 [Whalleya microplaca]|nr:hypothetical protein F5B20DRAFT_125245 [Whalleya microplaca]
MAAPTPRDELPNRMNLGLPFRSCSGPNCIVRENLLQCSGCKVVLYCGAAHQRADRPRHKTSCNIVKTTQEKLAQEEAALRARPGDDEMGPDAFENAQAQFWFWRPTRPYMQARYDLMQAILNIRTGEAVQAALGHALGMLQLSRGDNLGVRSQVPALYLRLGRDQEAYDFIKWYALVPSSYEWINPDLLYLDIHGEDAFEHFEDHAKRLVDVSFLASMTQLKIRLLLDVMMLERYAKKPGNRNASFETKMEWVREDAISDVLYKRRDIVERSDYTDLIADLRDQVAKLVACVNEVNEYYWPALQHPEKYSHSQPTIYTHGSPEEIILVFRHTWYSWAECAAALEIAKDVAK